MSQERIFHSLPKKTQPTASSSRLPKTTAAKTNCLETEGCPEVSEFRLPRSIDELYIHRLDIDYGRLERPNFYYFNGPKYERVVKMTDPTPNISQLNEEMNTKRFTGISLLSAENQLQERDTEKKGRQFQYINELTQQLHPSSSQSKCRKVKIKLAEVKAYEGMTKRDGSVKRLHSRIVKMAVGGGKMTTKVITYPDNNEYLKLCGLR